jgi:hypothetical protein
MTATADQQAAQNRLTIRVNVRFTTRKKKQMILKTISPFLRLSCRTTIDRRYFE